ncbi:hypothetical protein DL96DRAFT_1759947 [Flagelloscypha sp. PMI_526]|nr:hypothetical protein DL96DRAFT_1759947 [Flagelloscypha sp. PMI_526]
MAEASARVPESDHHDLRYYPLSIFKPPNIVVRPASSGSSVPEISSPDEGSGLSVKKLKQAATNGDDRSCVEAALEIAKSLLHIGLHYLEPVNQELSPEGRIEWSAYQPNGRPDSVAVYCSEDLHILSIRRQWELRIASFTQLQAALLHHLAPLGEEITSWCQSAAASFLLLALRAKTWESHQRRHLLQAEIHPFAGGGYADVHRGNFKDRQDVCLKVLRVYLHPGQDGEDEIAKRGVIRAFLHEAVLWHQLNHPNILPFLGVSFDAFPNRVCFVSPLMENGDIMSYVKRTSSSVDTRLTLLFGVAKGIQYLHEMDICHGDIKGINILIDGSMQPRIADLGISSIVTSQSETLQLANTTSRGFQGSLRWAPPEVILPHEFLNPHSSTTRDINAFGCTMLEVLTGQFPFCEERRDPAILLRVIKGDRPKRPAAEIVPQAAWELIQHCWAHDPDHRATILEIIKSFHILTRVEPTPEAEKPGPWGQLLSDLAGSSPGGTIPIFGSISPKTLPQMDVQCSVSSNHPGDSCSNVPPQKNTSSPPVDTNPSLSEQTAAPEEVGRREKDIDNSDPSHSQPPRNFYAHIPLNSPPTLDNPVAIDPPPPYRPSRESANTIQASVHSLGIPGGPFVASERPLTDEVGRVHSPIDDLISEETHLEPPNEIPSVQIGRSAEGEKTRQSLISELIQGERTYVTDLRNIEVLFLEPLARSNSPIAESNPDQFINDVFQHYRPLLKHHEQFLRKLEDIKQLESPVIDSITAPLMETMVNSRHVYLKYISNIPIADFRIEEETRVNLASNAFIQRTLLYARARRMDMKTFLNLPCPRLLCYARLLKEIKNHTLISHPDYTEIPALQDHINELAKSAQRGLASGKIRAQLWEYHKTLVFDATKWVDIGLLEERRSLVWTGNLLIQSKHGRDSLRLIEVFAILLDNYLVLATLQTNGDTIERYIYMEGSPIPFDLLALEDFSTGPVRRDASVYGWPEAAPVLFPFTLRYAGREGGLIQLYVPSVLTRSEWRDKFDEALGLRNIVRHAERLFEIEYLTRETFSFPSPLNTLHRSCNSLQTRKITCSAPFITTDNRELIMFGILADLELVLILANKSLWAYKIAAFDPASHEGIEARRSPEKVSGMKDVRFFAATRIKGKRVVIWTESVITLLEPTPQRPTGTIQKRTSQLLGRFSYGSKASQSQLFRAVKEVAVQECLRMVFLLEGKMFALCSSGFLIMDILSRVEAKRRIMPHPSLLSTNDIIKRCRMSKPLAILKSRELEFLLCYQEFGVYVDEVGVPIQDRRVIEWEGTAHRVSLHQPCLFVFSPDFLEIRQVEDGKLVQIIFGRNLQCLWDSWSLTEGQPQDDNIWLKPTIHALTNVEHGHLESICQEAFELVPEISLSPQQEGSDTTPTTSRRTEPSARIAQAPVSWLVQRESVDTVDTGMTDAALDVIWSHDQWRHTRTEIGGSVPSLDLINIV